MQRPVFVDPTRRRWRRIQQFLWTTAIAAATVTAVFVASLMVFPALPAVPGLTESLQQALHPGVPHLLSRQARLREYLLTRSRSRLQREISVDGKRLARGGQASRPAADTAIVAGFYAPWNQIGLYSLQANAPKMTHLFASWLELSKDGRHLDLHDWDPIAVPHNADALAVARRYNLRIFPVLTNAQEQQFDPARTHVLLADEAAQKALALETRKWIQANDFQGLNVDFENLYAEDYARMPAFLRILRQELSPYGLRLTADLEPGNKNLDWGAVASICDFVVVMGYDQHSGRSLPGAISSVEWFRGVVRRGLGAVPRAKLVIGLGNYGYDWSNGDAEPLTFQGALLAARENGGNDVRNVIDFDPVALNPTFNYRAEDGSEHEVWFLDAVSAANEWRLARGMGVRGAALWALGSEDPSIWQFFDRRKLLTPIDPALLSRMAFPYYVEFVGDGELLHVASEPTPGTRSIEVDPSTKLALDEQFVTLPTSFVIRRTGYSPKTVAITIDDGPAEPYTAEVLDELRKLNVKATFFLIGENAEHHPDLVRRILAEGHDIGNHSFTHPNIGEISPSRARLEINSCQRAVESITGRSMLFFRPPYNADAEPTTAEEVQPVILASELGYVCVGEYIDPQDWNLDERMPDGTVHHRNAVDIARSAIEQVHKDHGNTILLHDGGGDREQTVLAIPMIVNELRREGYRFVTASQLLGVSRDVAMPRVSPHERYLIGGDRVFFDTVYFVDSVLRLAFLSAIALGVARMLLVAVLAVLARRREARRRFDPSYRPSVSVCIAAYNEEKVIARTIETLLGSSYPVAEIVVVDDGSADDTSGVVRRRFGDNPLVRLLQQENGGKSSALNRAIELSRGEVLVLLDADTQFAPETIGLLVRHFADPRVGAVAGNVKVGNPWNLITRWQKIEYTTSQNLDRRAYSILNCIPVVPGAAGAWRREAIVDAGGFVHHTLAEDTDLTWTVRERGWRVENEPGALAFTEAPDTVRTLFKQRFRWTYGTLQALWKHRGSVGRHGWFGRFMLPAIWVFQILYPFLSPLVDLQILWALLSVGVTWMYSGLLVRDWQPLPQSLTTLSHLGYMYLFFFLVELAGAWLAYSFEREKKRQLFWLFWQRFVYRQLIYAVVYKAIRTAAKGKSIGWGKLERRGTVGLLEPAAEAN